MIQKTITAITLVLCLFSANIQAQNNSSDSLKTIQVQIDPLDKQQVFEGWGGSLCWWANIIGGYSDEKIKMVCDWITHPTTGLNMNIFRFNIGGGDQPVHHHMRADGGDMPGYKDSLTAPYNWKSDANQRKILQQLIASRIANTGRNDVQLVAFSNSPPWWMTVSGCAAGSVEGNTPNLKPDMYDDFADYLTEVTKYYHDSLGITFHHLEPFNEPFSTWWKAEKGQEGCYFSQEDQHKMIRELYAAMQRKDMLEYCSISAMDANSLDEGYAGLKGYKLAGDILPKLTRIDVHSYFGAKRDSIAVFARENKLPVWQSESGPLNVGGNDAHQLMVMCDRVITDIKELKCTAWVDWQLVNDKSQLWGMIVGRYDESEKPLEQGLLFFLRAQYSRYIKADYHIIGNNSPQALTAVSPDNKELVVIISNSGLNQQTLSIDLSNFKLAKSTISGTMSSAQKKQELQNQSIKVALIKKQAKLVLQPQSVATFSVALSN